MSGHPAAGYIRNLNAVGTSCRYFSLPEAARGPGLSGLSALPYSLRVLAENLLRHADRPDVESGVLADLAQGSRGFEIPFRPARVLLQDLLGVPVMVDFAALREAVAQAGGDPLSVNPAIPVDFVIDHSIIADVSGTPDAARRNMEIEYARNRERFAFLAWCQQAFRDFRVVPPDSGIVHQINVERLARVAWTSGDLVYPDTLVCNDSHATMVNGIGVLGWGVGGIEAEAAMLGRALSMRVPEVLGVRVTGALPAGATATDLTLTIAELLRRVGVVGKFVEFFGPGLEAMPVADRATIANMAPEYGATCVFFPVDQKCADYLAFTGRDAATVGLAKSCAQAQGLWRDTSSPEPRFDASIDLDLSAVERSLAGPRRPQQRVALGNAAKQFVEEMPSLPRDARADPARARRRARAHARRRRRRHRGDHQLHQHLQSREHDRCGPARAERRRARARGATVGQDLVRPGLQGGDGVPAAREARRAAGSARLSSHGLRLHHLQRQLRSARPRNRGRGEVGGARIGRGALRQPQFRGARASARSRRLPGVAAARRRLCHRRPHHARPADRPARRGPRRQARLPGRPLA